MQSVSMKTLLRIVGMKVDNTVFQLTNEFEKIDYLTLDDEATIFRIAKSDWNTVDAMINNDINETTINETIQKVIQVNNHTILKVGHKPE